VLTVVLVALVGAGCGSASSTSTTTHAKATPSPASPSGGSATGSGTASATSGSGTPTGSRTTTAPGSTQPGTTSIPAGSVAVVAGAPITETAFRHWMYVAAKSQAAQAPGQPVIVPDPPTFKRCISQARNQLPGLKKQSIKTLVAECEQLYRTLMSQVMAFLIQSDWIQADGARLRVAPSDAEVAATLTKDKQQQFPGGKGYQAFLAKTGQSAQDVRFRVRINLIFSRLTAREKGSATARETALIKRLKRLFGAQTLCTAAVLMADCANYRSG